ncbi:MAG: diacylglycerol kinase [Gammaproteobacteria bacterium]|nr:diacylglycerol kinase [Gammaproteobacteria bacterium]
MASHDKALSHIVRAAGYSLKGLKAALAHETAFRIEIALFLVLAPLALWLGNNGVERALLLGCLLLVLLAELFNSAIEAVVDRSGTEFNELAGRAKDLASAAVMVSHITVVVVWGLVLLGH